MNALKKVICAPLFALCVMMGYAHAEEPENQSWSTSLAKTTLKSIVSAGAQFAGKAPLIDAKGRRKEKPFPVHVTKQSTGQHPQPAQLNLEYIPSGKQALKLAEIATECAISEGFSNKKISTAQRIVETLVPVATKTLAERMVNFNRFSEFYGNGAGNFDKDRPLEITLAVALAMFDKAASKNLFIKSDRTAVKWLLWAVSMAALGIKRDEMNKYLRGKYIGLSETFSFVQMCQVAAIIALMQRIGNVIATTTHAKQHIVKAATDSIEELLVQPVSKAIIDLRS